MNGIYQKAQRNLLIVLRYLTTNSSGYRAIFSDECGIYDEWDAFVEESRMDYDE